MAQSSEVKTSAGMRIAVIVIAVLMLGSTVALYMGMVMSYGNSGDTSEQSPEEQKLESLYAEYLAERDKDAEALSGKYFESFKKYLGEVKSFNAADVTALKTRDLVKGTGKAITDDWAEYSAFYIGWLADEKIFDSSFDNTEEPNILRPPLTIINESTDFLDMYDAQSGVVMSRGGLIEGWEQGIVGMKIGGVREITIPSALGYGDQESASIPANSPLKFILMLVPKLERPEWTAAKYDEVNKLIEELYAEAAE